jgi:hypothetical protein
MIADTVMPDLFRHPRCRTPLPSDVRRGGPRNKSGVTKAEQAWGKFELQGEA